MLIKNRNGNHNIGKKPAGIGAVLLVAALFAGRIMLGDVQTSPAEPQQDNSENISVQENLSENEQNSAQQEEAQQLSYTFRTEGQLKSHYEKHGIEMGFASEEEYLAAANRVVNTDGVLHKLEAEDGDDVYYLEETNEFVIVSTDGYIRTYFNPDAGIEYFNRQ